MFLKKSNFIVADSSFYLCFLEDIKRPDILILMLAEFEFAIGGKIHSEISRCEHYKSIDANEHLTILSDYDFSEALRPFFSKYENIKGEGEAIALAVILFGLHKLDKLILDENEPRRWVENNLPHLIPIMIGTVGFIGKCCYEFHVLDKEESLQILSEIQKSPFRVTDKVLNEVRSLIN